MWPVDDETTPAAPSPPQVRWSDLVAAAEASAGDAGTAAGVRRRPVQQRGLQTLGLILDAAQSVLDERGLEGFTTNSIAERANVNIATLYNYFEDKVAILHELAARDELRRVAAMRELAETYRGGDWRSMVDHVIDMLVRVRTEHPGTVAVRRAVAATPELADLVAEREQRLTSMLVDVMVMFRPELDRAVARRAAAPVAVAGGHVLDRAAAGEVLDTELILGFREMVMAHLDHVLG
jgi:AcrR family transcriptional regulator